VTARVGAAIVIGLALGAALNGAPNPADASRSSCGAISRPPNAPPPASRPLLPLDLDTARRTVTFGRSPVVVVSYGCTKLADAARRSRARNV
jgi:hypothetical protein